MGIFRALSLIAGPGRRDAVPPPGPQLVLVTPHQLTALQPERPTIKTYLGKRPQLALIDADGYRVPVRAITRVAAEFDEARAEIL